MQSSEQDPRADLDKLHVGRPTAARRIITALVATLALVAGVVALRASTSAEAEDRAPVERAELVSVSTPANPWAVNAAADYAWADQIRRYVEAVRFGEAVAFAQANAARIAAEEAVARASAPRSSGGGGGGNIGGSCGVPPDTGEAPPPGFPGYVIERESGGRLDASNGSYFGRAQISCQHYGSNGGCVGMSYAACWERLWAGGAGASNWAQTL